MPKSTTAVRFETCESRRLLSSSGMAQARLDHHTLSVRGIDDSANVITVTQDVNANTLTVTVVSSSSTTDGQPDDDSTAGGDDDGGDGDTSTAPSSDSVTFTQTFDATGVTLVKVRGGKLADTISLVGTDGTTPFSLDARVNGDDGNDTITTGSGNDRIDGAKGDDVIDAGAGNDLIWGGRGNDQLSGGDGNDTLFGGTGNDTMDGGAGNDVLFSLVGHDSVTGGGGGDTFVTKKPKHGHGVVHDFGKHDHQKSTTKTAGDTDDADATA